MSGVVFRERVHEHGEHVEGLRWCSDNRDPRLLCFVVHAEKKYAFCVFPIFGLFEIVQFALFGESSHMRFEVSEDVIELVLVPPKDPYRVMFHILLDVCFDFGQNIVASILGG